MMLIPHYGTCQDGNSAGTTLGNAALGKFGSKEGVSQNIATPLTSADKPMTTLDGTGSFNAQLLCPSSNRFLDVLIQPAGTGDIATVFIAQDLDMNNSADYSYTVPFSVSGICANGLIGCQAGTWINCTYWKWVADSSARVRLAPTGLNELGGCYCINNSCGNALVWNDLSILLRDIGGGAAAAIQAVNPKYAITDAKIVDAQITYYGQSTMLCSQVGSASGSSTPEVFFAGGRSEAGLLGAKDAEVTAQQNDPGSYYNLITQSSAAQNSQGDYNSCSLIRNIAVQTVTVCPNRSQYMDTIQKCGITPNDYTPMILSTGRGGAGCYFTASIAPSGGDSLSIGNGLCGDPGDTIVKNARIIYRCGGIQHIIYSSEYQTAQFPACPSSDQVFVQGYYYTAAAGSIDCSYYPGAVPFSGNLCTLDAVQQDILTETVNNQCTTYESDSRCRLRQEKVDGVFTMNNYSPTSLTPFSTCKTFTGVEAHSVCKDWWRKDRSYFCKRDESFNFDDAKRRVDTIAGSAQNNSGTLTYTDTRKNADGSWVTDQSSIDLGSMGTGSYGTCDQACKTRKPRANTQAGMSGTTTQYQKNSVSYDFYYRKCNEGVCAAGAGEEIIKACQCMSEFAEAASLMSAMDGASKDLICSSGERK